jgi:hypothetical protein
MERTEWKPVGNQFTIEEIDVIHEALVFTLNCVACRDIPPFHKMKAVLTKVEGLIKQV